ncbi:MAG: D-alanyl-D-alanine carboxypeptidase [Alphaproteobacteria bacterium]|jgi:serine-type D-Ala-D-Ala carboxypeptidase (penicillin-binding protein 5/6)|nr:D-alanyl-D-alanine carboxypeptidase [Alphaproteobacteria bacterium]MBT4085439.1 D-alanyl-D-alanine carboxypeptidase [Alphaproteobacteria bacterium]MBT4546139.1 D-alanyl-D-alanine carboxypeptidase [Alphaproteobacteria bacterium]MBT7747344.1 D-alanyl-D-alanine carboxypeptidase [Alphaproteobacteria bacterium]
MNKHLKKLMATGFASGAIALGSMVLSSTSALAFETAAKYAILVDQQTGRVLLEKDADTAMAPASMSKLMTVLMLFERLGDGSLSMDDTFPVSEKAWRMGGSKMFVGVNTRVPVKDLLRGIVVQSGNDACIVVAEGLASSEAAFADQMTARGKEIGLENSIFANATGWPDPGQRMSTRDLASVAKQLIEKFPQYYPIFAEKTFTYNGIRQGNRNPLLYRYDGADGLKTGHTEESGYGLVSSATRKGRRLVLVVNGLTSVKQRSRESERLLDWGFREFGNYDLFRAGDKVVDAAVWLGSEGKVPLVIENDMTLTLARKARRKMKVSIELIEPVPAPITKGQQVGEIIIRAPETDEIRVPLLAGSDVAQLGLFGRLGAAFEYLAWGAPAK